MSKFYALSPASAIDDLIEAIKYDVLADEEVMWLHLARVRAGQDDRQEFENNSNSLLSGKWPAPLVALYRDKGTVEDVFAKAKIGEASDQVDQLCGANFYTAEWYLTKNMGAKAKHLFQVAKDTCPKVDPEGMFARSELAALDKNIQH